MTYKTQLIQPIAALESNILFTSNGDVVWCYEGHLPEIYSLSEKDYEALHACWFQAVKTLPAGTIIHKQDCYQQKEYCAEELPNTSFLEQATRSHFRGRKYLTHRCYVFFIFTKNKSLTRAHYINPFKNSNKAIPKQLDDALLHFKAAVEDAVAFINTSRKMAVEPLDAAAIETLTRSYFNGYNTDVDTDIVLDNNQVIIGDHYFDALAVTNETCFGEAVQTSTINEKFSTDSYVFHKGFIDGLGLALDENHMVNQILILDDKHKWRKLLDKKVEELNKSSNFGTQNKVVLGKIQDILEQINTDETSRVSGLTATKLLQVLLYLFTLRTHFS
ncbi:putative protein DUF3875 [Leeuwenhoekiella aestuarii]|uniref:TraG N-terminal Bacteroidetes domain-containing protein n=1 Tax=Leeuwenhoekiella aestuarii TaxID=2249426 RepID=A0A4Q0NU58_9FLAO|nr:DUF3875 domain-containing protein [Leeuwenhoekiella aestuarii]RXG11634.1 putative protein DUF3875 [Leeuwenhoekiella aestuarii]RXG15155.1 putative protein DUF3875 [Leeuwenhoekiella aestuarii]